MQEEITIKWDLLGAKLATLSDNEQSEFFKGFAIELNHFDSHYLKEMQMLYIKDKLEKKIKDILKEYLPALWYENDK